MPTTFMRVQNIHGLPSSVEAISCSLADTPINFLPDIIVLTETNCVDADLIEFAGYRKLDPIPAIRGPQGGRPSAGMLILVKDTYDGPLQRIETKETRQSICCAAIALGCPKTSTFPVAAVVFYVPPSPDDIMLQHFADLAACVSAMERRGYCVLLVGDANHLTAHRLITNKPTNLAGHC